MKENTFKINIDHINAMNKPDRYDDNYHELSQDDSQEEHRSFDFEKEKYNVKINKRKKGIDIDKTTNHLSYCLYSELILLLSHLKLILHLQIQHLC